MRLTRAIVVVPANMPVAYAVPEKTLEHCRLDEASSSGVSETTVDAR
jgi:hypothetical protein